MLKCSGCVSLRVDDKNTDELIEYVCGQSVAFNCFLPHTACCKTMAINDAKFGLINLWK